MGRLERQEECDKGVASSFRSTEGNGCDWYGEVTQGELYKGKRQSSGLDLEHAHVEETPKTTKGT